MCLAVPMRVKKINKNIAEVELSGIRRNIDISLIEGVNVGDYVIVHAGFAIQKLSKKDARTTLKLFSEMKNGT
ncbi:MAG TPA: HypC/HybG/HupF family hydrogenase formation chaperone [bacterium]|jgi:hydrogenase expression/formation protein HypC|nr:HypC/HybG/HupF family hydrogenase formation chaperone [bacterium]HON06112.1 HypC/HybG/HupF family hydrogenase formation chaperone [bacterium]